MRIVEVEWNDAGLESMQITEEDARNITSMPRRNVGYLLEGNKENIVLVFGIIQDRERHCGVLDQVLVIPKGMVKEIKELK